MDSRLDWGGHWIGCTDTHRQLLACENVERHRVHPVPGAPHVPELPRFIPQLRAATRRCRPPSGRLYAVSLSTLLSTDGDPRYSSRAAVSKRLGISESTPLLCVGTAPDRQLELLWKRHGSAEAWTWLRDLDFVAVTTTTFSVWDPQPRFDQIYAQDRNLCSYDILTSHGVPTIPFMFCVEDDDYEAATAWLTDRPDVTIVGASAQQYRTNRDFEVFLERLNRLREAAPRRLRYLVVGTGVKNRIIQVVETLGGDVSIVTAKPVMKAVSGHLASPDLKYSFAPSATPQELLARNLAAYDRVCGGKSSRPASGELASMRVATLRVRAFDDPISVH